MFDVLYSQGSWCYLPTNLQTVAKKVTEKTPSNNIEVRAAEKELRKDNEGEKR